MFDEKIKPNTILIVLIITNVLTILGLISTLLYPYLFKETATKKAITIGVTITGEVNNPGFYEVTEGMRVIDLITVAGGFTEKADISSVNQGQLLVDEMIVFIQSTDSEIKLVNINTANLETLMTLKGIGEVKAQAIITYRELHGPFKRIEELMRVNGIGEKTFESLKDYVTV